MMLSTATGVYGWRQTQWTGTSLDGNVLIVCPANFVQRASPSCNSAWGNQFQSKYYVPVDRCPHSELIRWFKHPQLVSFFLFTQSPREVISERIRGICSLSHAFQIFSLLEPTACVGRLFVPRAPIYLHPQNVNAMHCLFVFPPAMARNKKWKVFVSSFSTYPVPIPNSNISQRSNVKENDTLNPE
jgi:hypothetical protein